MSLSEHQRREKEYHDEYASTFDLDCHIRRYADELGNALTAGDIFAHDR